MFIIISDNEKYNLELKELANMLFAYKKKIYSIFDISKAINEYIENNKENLSSKIFLNEEFEKFNAELEDILNKKTEKLENFLKNFSQKLNISYDLFCIKKTDDIINARLIRNDAFVCKLSSNIDFKEKHIYKKLLYQSILSSYDNIKSKWGILTGIRPVKIVNELKKENKSDKDIDDILKNNYLLSGEKISLIKNISDIQDEIKKILADDISVYISIPFCPSRCNYCSFFSIDINLGKKYIKDYLINLDFEIKQSLKKSYFKNKTLIFFLVD